MACHSLERTQANPQRVRLCLLRVGESRQPGSNPALEESFQRDWPSGHAMRLNSRTGKRQTAFDRLLYYGAREGTYTKEKFGNELLTRSP